MTETAPPRQLPVRLPPYPDELLSSWISRHAAFYAVPPLVMLQHCLPEASSLRAVDLHLSGDQEVRLASDFRRQTGCFTSNDLHQCAEVVASTNRREAGTDLCTLQPR